MFRPHLRQCWIRASCSWLPCSTMSTMDACRALALPLDWMNSLALPAG